MSGIRIVSTGRYLPKRVVSNEDFTKMVETSDEWISTRTGIKNRHISEGESPWYMGAEAAKLALEQAGCSPNDIDMILVSCVTPDYVTPSVSCMIQGALGIDRCMCIDMNCACTGFVYALDMAYRYLKDDEVRKVLVIGTEKISSMVDYSDRATCVLFGDGAGACLVEKSDGLYHTFLSSDGSGVPRIYTKRNVPKNPFETLDGRTPYPGIHAEDNGYLVMDGKEVYKFATKAMSEAVETACQKAGIQPQELKIIVPHQANYRIVHTAMKYLGLPIEAAYLNMSRYGNTSSASIPIALDELNRDRKLNKGDKVCIVGFGAGLTYGASVFEW